VDGDIALDGAAAHRGSRHAIVTGGERDEESTTYQAILREGREEGREEGLAMGRVEEARAILLRQGTKRFGTPSDQIRAALAGITQIERLEVLTERLLDVESWDELLAG
jgi:predicted transposase YdaD